MVPVDGGGVSGSGASYRQVWHEGVSLGAWFGFEVMRRNCLGSNGNSSCLCDLRVP